MITIEGIIKETVSKKVGYNEWNVVEKVEKKNKILSSMLTHLSRSLGNASPSPLTKITFGSNGATPQQSDTKSIMTNTFTKPVLSVAYPSFNSVKFTYSLLEAEHNGNEIREYALTSDDGNTIFSRIIRGMINKEIDVKIDGTWEIIFYIKGV